MRTSTGTGDQFLEVEGLRTRYIEEGSGTPVILLHGASLGSSAEVWRRNLGPLASYGLRVIAYDQPGFGLTDDPPNWGLAYRTSFVLSFMTALRLDRAALVGHSQAGAMAVRLGLSHPDRISHVVVLGTGSLLPPLPDGGGKKGVAEGEEGGEHEPTASEVRALLDANLFHDSLVTDDEVALRLRMSTGKNFRAFLSRQNVGAEARADGQKQRPLWERLGELPQPLLMLYGREDRGQAGKRAAQAKQSTPKLNVHVVPNCKHLVQWDAADLFHELAGEFLRNEPVLRQ